MLRVASTLGAALIAGSVSAQGFHGAEIGLEYYDNSDGGFNQTQLEGSVAFSLGSVGVQLDAGTWQYDGQDDGYSTVGVHAYTGLSNGMYVGAFYTRDDWGGTIYPNAGVEIYGTVPGNMPIMFQAAAGNYTCETCSYDMNFVTLGLDVDLEGPWSVQAGFTATSGDSDEGNVMMIGASYDTPFGAVFSVEAHRLSDPGYNVIGASLDFPIGNGVKFDQRSWVNLLPAY